MTESNDTAAADGHQEQELGEQGPAEAPWTPPLTLTPPPAMRSRPPVLALATALGVSLGCGLALWVTGQFLYIYIFCNLLIGGALGWALSLAAKKEGFTSLPALMTAGVALAALPYALMRVGFYVQLLPDFHAQGYDPSLFEFLYVFLSSDTLFGLEIGFVGNVILLLVEVGITVYALYGRLLQGLAEARIASIPEDVVSFVVQGFAHQWDTARVREELAQRGWRDAADQDRAIGTGFDIIAALQAQAQQA